MDTELMTVEERKAILSKIARNDAFTRQFHVGDKLEAIDLYNKMDNLYKQTVVVEREVVHTFIFQLPDGTHFTPGLLPEVVEGTIVSEESINVP